jgi:four helix bundle protein
MHIYSFEKLEVWKLARRFVVKLYQITEKLPVSERFGMTSQIRKAGVSICSNIAEGSGRRNVKDKGRFYEIAYGSLLEIVNQLIISNDLRWIPDEELSDLRIDSERISKMLNALHKSVFKS